MDRQLMSYGLLRGAFRPSDNVLRAVRQRHRLIKDRARSVQAEGVAQMNVQLDTVRAT